MKIKKIILVLGSEGNIGKPLVKNLLKKNYLVIAVDNKFIREIKKKNYYYIKCDVTKKNSLKKLFNKIKKIGKLYAAINCIYPRTKTWGTKFESLDISKVKNHLYFQLGLPILISKEICEQFLNNGSGKLINISSIQGTAAPKFDHYKNTNMISPIEYSIAKSGIISLTKYLAKYYKRKKIIVNCISPGGIKSNQPLSFQRKYNKSCNSKGLLNGIDIVNAIMFLISEKSNYITGQNIIIDDGWSL